VFDDTFIDALMFLLERTDRIRRRADHLLVHGHGTEDCSDSSPRDHERQLTDCSLDDAQRDPGARASPEARAEDAAQQADGVGAVRIIK